MGQDPEQQTPPFARLMQLITGHWVAAAVYAAAKLRLADHLQDGPKTSDQLAQAVGGHPSSIYRVMRALATLGVFQESDGKRFSLTEVGQLLRSDHPQSMRSMALFQGAEPHWKGWGSFLYSAQTGKPAFEHVHGRPFFEYCKTDREFAEAFNGAMTAMSATLTEPICDEYDFSGIRRLVDVGGGHGYLLSRILKHYPQLSGVVFDLPEVVEGAKKTIAREGLSERCEVAGGSFFESVPSGDAYIAKNIIHDWDDEHALKILKNMRQAMTGKGKVLLVEIVITPQTSRTMGVMIDLEMLHATHGGRERTRDEFKALFGSAGLALHRVIELRSGINVLEAVAAD